MAEIAAAMIRHRGRKGAREIAVWDPLVRLVHWLIVFVLLLNGAILEEESTAHEWVGYAALVLVGLRLFWALIGPRHARFSAFPPRPKAAILHMRDMLGERRKVHLSHNPLGALMVYNLWLCIALMGVTGYMMTTLWFFGVGWVEDVHQLIFSWLMLSIIAHIGGVLFDSWRTGVNLARSMVTGRKTIPEDAEIE